MVTEKNGIFLCSCSKNLSAQLDFQKMRDALSGLGPNVKIYEHDLLCSNEGVEFFKQTIKDDGLSRMLIAGCSPKQHEHTFQKAAQEEGKNPFMINLSNIREQCVYVTENAEASNDKALKMIKASFKRLQAQKPLEKNEITVNPDVLVIGAGIAGIEAALLLAQKNRMVYLVENEPNIGGCVTRQEELFPNLECATCLLEPKMDSILHHDRIKLMTMTTVTESVGFAGNYSITLAKRPRRVSLEKCLGCLLCFEPCPVSVPNEYNEGMDNRKAVFLPYMGALPFCVAIDEKNCLRTNGQDPTCDKCKASCGFDAFEFEEQTETVKIDVGAVVIATGHSNFDKFKFLEGKVDRKLAEERFFSAMEFERLLSQTGPTNGEIQFKDGSVPKTFAIIHCAGSRSEKFHENCAGICCKDAIKFNKMIRHKLPTAKVCHFYRDMVLPDKNDQHFMNSLTDKHLLVRVADTENATFTEQNGRIKVAIDNKCASVDCVILMTPMEASQLNQKTKEIFDLTLDEQGYIKEEHALIGSASTEIMGIYMAGSVQGPKDVRESSLQAGAAAGKVMAKIIPGELMELESMVAVANSEKCGGCKICISLCPYKAISFDIEKKSSVIQAILCKGCGTCAAACPSGAITARNFENGQVMAELEEVL